MARTGARCLLAALSLGLSGTANAAVRITEFMYQGAGGGDREFFELTNFGSAAVDVSGWTFNDSNANDPVAFGDSIGSIAPLQSVILTELSAEAFRTYWGLSAAVPVFSIGGDSNLGGSDTINIYSSATQSPATLVDSVSYSGTTRGISRNRPNTTGTVTNADFVNSAPGDAYGSAFAGAPGTTDLGNPGRFAIAAPVPEPASWALLIGGFGLVGGVMRRRVRPAAALRLA